MRVMHVLNSAGGGASVGAYELMRTSAVSSSGISHYAVYPGDGSPAEEQVQAVTEAAATVPMRWWNRKTSLSPARRALVWGREMQLTSGGLKTQLELRRLIRDWRIDLVHTNTAATNAGALAARLAGIPHIWHVRERVGKDGFMKFPVSDRRLARRVGDASARIVPMSKFAGELFCAHGQGHKTKVVYDGVDPHIFAGEEVRGRAKELRARWGIPADAVLVGKVAAVTSIVKRHDTFIRAVGRLVKAYPNVYFAIIGSLPARSARWVRREIVEYHDSLLQLARAEGCGDRLLFTGNVTDAGALMNAIDVLAHACPIEGFGRVAIEAMCAGKPVVGPSRGGIAESVVDGETGVLVRPDDPGDLASGLERLLASPELRREYGGAGRARANEVFSPERHLRNMTEVYEQALATR